MKRIGCALFIIFYFAATIGVATERCAYMAGRVGNAASEFDNVESPLASFVKYLPYFSHAKKGQIAVAVVPREFSWSLSVFVQKFEPSPSIAFLPSPATRRPSLRAPPALV